MLVHPDSNLRAERWMPGQDLSQSRANDAAAVRPTRARN